MEELLEQARERRLSGNHHDSGDLAGFCFDNAFVLYNLLKEKNLNPRIVCGATDRYSSAVLESRPVESIDSVEELEGMVHYWVELDGKILDIACDIGSIKGKPIVRDSLPDEYYRFSDSYSYASDILESARARRCNYCGGRDRYCGCPEENKK